MSLKKNILANYASQAYTALIGIFMVPVYIKYMGSEAYGLVGFFSLLQSIFAILDMGLSHTMSREASRFRGGKVTAADLKALLRSLEIILAAIAIVGVLVVVGSSNLIASHWLNPQGLASSEVSFAVKIIALIVALRWISGLFSGLLIGLERQVWLSKFNMLIATLRFVAVVPLLIYISAKPDTYFTYQLFIAIIELLAILVFSYKSIGWSKSDNVLKVDFALIKSITKFSLSISALSIIWILATQIDKIVVSKILSLSDFGYFSAAVLAAGGILLISQPISTAILPRLVKLEAEGNVNELVQLYRKSTQLVSIIAFPIAFVIANYSRQLLELWTGNANLASVSASVLAFYAVGNALRMVSAYSYYIQYAKGNLKLHLMGNTLFLIFLAVSLIYFLRKFGVAGSGFAWLLVNIAFLLIWVPIVHKSFIPGIHMRWILHDVGTPVLISGFLILIFNSVIPRESAGFSEIVLVGFSVFSAVLFGNRSFRNLVPSVFKKI